jgi:hypothetical protein
MKQKVLIDVMVGDRFFCQLKPELNPIPKLIGGKIYPVYRKDEIEKAILEMRPSLSGKKFTYELSNQKIFNY